MRKSNSDDADVVEPTVGMSSTTTTKQHAHRFPRPLLEVERSSGDQQAVQFLDRAFRVMPGGRFRATFFVKKPLADSFDCQSSRRTH